MELNGIANMKMVIETALRNKEIDWKVAMELETQLEHLNRYMVAVSDEIDNSDSKINIPYWHDVRDNPDKYRTLKQKQEALRESQEND